MTQVVETKVQKEIGSKHLSLAGRLSLIKDIRAYTMIFALLAIWVYFAFATDGAFLSSRNLSNLARQMAVTSILATGMVLVIVAGHIDLSVGSVVGLTGGVAAILHVWLGWGAVPAILVALLLGLGIGLFQGYWVAYQGVPAFIVTLSGMMAFRGILLGIANGQTIAPLQDSFKNIGQGYLNEATGYALAALAIAFTIAMMMKKRQARIKYGFEVSSLPMEALTITFYCALIAVMVGIMNKYEGIPVPVLLVAVLVITFTFITNKTRFGRQIYAIGGNPEAARFSGIDIKKRLLIIFVINGLLAAIAGVVLTARLNAATISAGQMYELDAIASTVIGGTSLMGGVGSIPGAIVGALVMASLDNGMSMLNTEAFWQYIVKGFILLIAVWMDIASKKRVK
ncbi:MAG: sugar ABC transporter permease [Clostridia bacterium]|nr:sugar ABC transporter permease [Clostridia bacterium]